MRRMEGVQERVPNADGRIDPSTEGVNLKNDRIDLGGLGIFNNPLDKSRHTGIDHAFDLDIDMIDRLSLGTARQQQQRQII